MSVEKNGVKVATLCKYKMWFQNFFGEHTDEKNIGWMQKASKEINTLVNRRLEKAINQYLRSLGG